LLSVGKEEGKGNEVVKAAFSLLKSSGLNFIGNLEGNDITAAKANVIVCDGFVGNVIAKYTEGLGATICQWLQQELQNDLPESRLKTLNDKLFRLTVPADTTGGGPLWAVDGVVFKAHGRSRHPEVATTIGSAKKAVEMDIVGALKDELTKVRRRIGAK
jgi:glycerol-3-phosphate acyltransferase PlsX